MEAIVSRCRKGLKLPLTQYSPVSLPKRRRIRSVADSVFSVPLVAEYFRFLDAVAAAAVAAAEGRFFQREGKESLRIVLLL